MSLLSLCLKAKIGEFSLSSDSPSLAHRKEP